MRTAGSGSANALSTELALDYLNEAVYHCSRVFHVAARATYGEVSGTELEMTTPMQPISVAVNGKPFAALPSYDPRFFGGMVRAFSTMGHKLVFSVELSGVTVDVWGFLTPALYTQGDLEREMVDVITDSETQLQWLPAAAASVARYRTLQSMAEELGAVDKAMYFAKMARDREADARVSHNAQGASSPVNAGDIL